MKEIPFLITSIATIAFMKRSGYSWMACILTGLLASPLLYIFLFAVINLSVNILLGVLKVSESSLSNETIFIGTTAFVIAIWIVFGFLLSKRMRTRKASG